MNKQILISAKTQNTHNNNNHSIIATLQTKIKILETVNKTTQR